MTKRWMCALVASAIVTHGVSALAQDDAPTVEQIKAAEENFSRGREAYKQENYAEAAEFFESADGHAPNEKVLELALSARQKAGHLDRAATLAQLGMERHPGSEKLQKLAEPLLVQAHSELLMVTIECDEPCSLLDGTRLVHGRPAEERNIFLTPGEHTIRAGWSHDRALSQEVKGAAGETRTLSFEAPPIPEEPEEEETTGGGGMVVDTGPREEPSGLPPLYFWISAGVTAAVGGVTIWSGVDTLNNPGTDAVRLECQGQGTDCPLYQEGKDKELRTNILLGATGVLGVGTVVLGAFFTNWSGTEAASGEEAPHTASIEPWIGVGDGATLGAKGRF